MRYLLISFDEYVMLVDTEEEISSEFVGTSVKEAIELFNEKVTGIDINVILGFTEDKNILYGFDNIEKFKRDYPEEFIWILKIRKTMTISANMISG